MGVLSPNENKSDEKAIRFELVNSKNLLLIFTRNPELGKCKTRLAATVGENVALEIYKFLLQHTANITKNLYATKHVYYSEEIWEDDTWDNAIFNKKIQEGSDLGVRMHNAFLEGFKNDFEHIIVIGSDMHDLSQEDIEQAFIQLNTNDYVIGPATDGGYYLLGMKTLNSDIFKNKYWGTNTVLKDTLKDLENTKTHILEAKNDVDIYEDIQNIKAFTPFIKNI
ncbi:TIGR04282 family arsenosugar biosynthesis glycosyltransferase [uncultured Maribacter sp.]|uniref:TIGR04282 family arsenosugar biosynthesis glycosyltransferase n=1 Tax=uncultured Maribacter sp. TaxID=431308 RepID=UPI002621617C|nr:TIGR04282 family arsenosugar biosynthesis glycosyltransferase [uncultured Maribacter sp.]